MLSWLNPLSYFTSPAEDQTFFCDYEGCVSVYTISSPSPCSSSPQKKKLEFNNGLLSFTRTKPFCYQITIEPVEDRNTAKASGSKYKDLVLPLTKATKIIQDFPGVGIESYEFDVTPD